MAKLVVLNGSEKGRAIDLPKTGDLVVGRIEDCDVTLDDQSVSRNHCRILCMGDKVELQDLGSSNGTLVNGRKVMKVVLKPNDVLEIGDTQVRFDAASDVAAQTIVKTARRDPLVNTTLGGCSILERLEKTPLGITYRAVQESTSAFVRLKVLPPAMTQNREIVQRFIRQAQAGALLKHPNVVQTLAAGKDRDMYYLITEYAGGNTLKQMLDEKGRNGTLDLPTVLDIALQIASALEYAFEHKIVHRDIKPANIFVAATGAGTDVKRFALLDNLWLAKALEGTGAANLTATGATLGTYGYMAPEQLDDAAHVDGRADIYSLAATMYRALAGTPPCAGKSLQETIDCIRHKAPASLVEVANVPGAVAKPVARALSKRPEDRQQTPHEFIVELQLARKFQVR